MSTKTFLFLLLASLAFAKPSWVSGVCHSSPPIALKANGVVSAEIQFGVREPESCQAVLEFSNHDFLPLEINFSSSRRCPTTTIAEFVLPLEVPNGDVNLFWLCAGQSTATCSSGIISNGTGNATSSNQQVSGRLGCVTTLTKPVIETITTSSVTRTVTSMSEVVSTDFPETSITSTGGSSQGKMTVTTRTGSTKTDSTPTGTASSGTRPFGIFPTGVFLTGTPTGTTPTATPTGASTTTSPPMAGTTRLIPPSVRTILTTVTIFSTISHSV